MTIFRSLVATLVISIIIWLGISYLPTYDLFIGASLIVLLMMLIVFTTFLLLLILGVIKWLSHKRIEVGHKKWLLTSIAILVSIVISKFIVNIFSTDYIGRINKEINMVVIDENIPPNDVEEIKKLAQTLSKDRGIRISYYECKPTFPDLENDEKTILIVGPKKSQMCQKGDVFLEIAGGYYVSPLGSERRSKYFLLRKINNEWEVIEDLGESRWMS